MKKAEHFTEFLIDTSDIHVEHRSDMSELLIAVPSKAIQEGELIAFFQQFDFDEQTENRMFDKIFEMIRNEQIAAEIIKRLK